MTKLNPRRAGGGWFLFYLDVLNSFMDGGFRRSTVASGTNLCTVVKVSAAGMLILALYASIAAAAVWLLLKPFQDQGLAPLIGLAIIAGIVLVVKAMLAVLRLVENWGESRENRLAEERQRQRQRMRDRQKEEESQPVQPELTDPSMFQLFREYIQAVKERFCPTVTWSEPVPVEPVWVASKLPNFVTVLFFGIAALVVAIQVSFLGKMVTTVSANVTQVGVTQCAFAGARSKDGLVTVDLDCTGGIKAWSSSNADVIKLLNDNRAVLQCTVYQDMEADCSEQPSAP